MRALRTLPPRPWVCRCRHADSAVLAGLQLAFFSLPDGQGKADSKGANAAWVRVPFPRDPALPEGSVPACSHRWGSKGLSVPRRLRLHARGRRSSKSGE